MQLLMKTTWKELSIEGLHGQVRVRYKLIREMIGSLYPGILRNEICELNLLIREKNETAYITDPYTTP